VESPCNESKCKLTHIRKNTKKKGKHKHICVKCDRQFIADDESHAWLQRDCETGMPKNVCQ